MGNENKDVELYTKVAALERQIEIVIPDIKADQKKILEILDNGLKEQMKNLETAFNKHCEESKTKENEQKEKKRFWLVGIRSVMITSATSLLGMFAWLLWFLATGRMNKFIKIVDNITP